MSSVRTRYLIPVLVCALLCAQVMVPAALVDNSGFQREPAIQFDEDTAKEIARLIEQKHKELLESITKMMDERKAALEKSLAERDKRIASLQKEVDRLKKELAAGSKPKPKPKPDPKPKPKPKPDPKPTSAFLGVGHIDHEAGAQVTTVHPNSPAAKAGLKEEDVIVAVNGKKVNSETLGGAVTAHAPGAKIKLDYLRAGKKGSVEVGLVDRDEFFAARSRKESAEKEPGHIVLGVTVEEDDKGIFAFEVEKGFTGQAAGVQKGDRITHFNGKEVKTLDELEALLKKEKSGKEVSLRLVRGAETIDVVVMGSSEKGGAKLVSSKSTKAGNKEPAPVKPPPEEKKEEAGFLGVGVGSVEGGLEVEIVVPDSAAAAYGIQVGDVIKQVNGKKTTSIEELKAALGGAPAGASVKVNLTRKGAAVSLNLVLGARGAKVEPPKARPANPKPPAAAKPAPKPKEKPPEKPKKKPETKGTLGIHARQTGEGKVVITMVIPGTAAEKGGLKAGDLVLKVGGKEIASLKDLQDVLGPLHAGESVTVRIRRGEEEKDIKVNLGEPLSSGSED